MGAILSPPNSSGREPKGLTNEFWWGIPLRLPEKKKKNPKQAGPSSHRPKRWAMCVIREMRGDAAAH